MRIVSFCFLGMTLAAASALHAAPSPSREATMADIAAERASLQPYERKLDTHLMRILRAQSGRLSPNLEASQTSVSRDADGRAHVVIESTDVPSLVATLRRPDVSLTFADSNYGKVEAWVPLPLLYTLANTPSVRLISSGLIPEVGVTSEGDALLKANLARQDTGFDGTGVLVGVISDGDQALGADIASGELPNTTITARASNSGDEGTAMMEIVHDLAPGAKIAFGSGSSLPNASGSDQTTGGGTMIGAIRAVEGAGAGVIVDDLTFFGQPMFEDGDIAKEMNFVVGQGIPFLTAAGNYNEKHYYGAYTDGGAFTAGTNTVEHADAFAPGALEYDFTISGSFSNIILQWDDPWNAPTNNYDLYVYAGNTLVGSSVQIQGGGAGHPYEDVGITYGGSTSAELRVVVGKTSGVGANFHLFATNGPISSDIPYSPGNAVVVNHAAASAITVGAVDAAGPYNMVESYSNVGPTIIKYPTAQTRAKPELCGIDDVSTAAPGFSKFRGTSAAAPHIAAVTALLRQAAPEMTPAQLLTALTTTATDIEAAGTDPASGAGLVNAEAAILWLRPDVSVDKTAITLTGYEGRFGATSSHFTITNDVASRGGQMTWTAASDASWLKINRTSGRANKSEEIGVWADTTGVTAPGATGHVTITLKNCVQTSIIVTVNLNLFAQGQTVTVNNTTTKLSDAITFANAHAGTTIKFAIPSSDPGYSGGVATVAGSGEMDITAPGTLIDGFSQTLFGGDTNSNGPEVKITGTLYFTSANNCVRGVDMANIPGSTGQNQIQPALWFEGPGAVGNTVIGCYIGCDPTGQTAAPTQGGVEIDAGASGNRVGGTKAADRNIISGCSSIGVQVLSDPSYQVCQDNVIVGNWVGIDANGTHGVGSMITGIQLQTNCAHNVVGGSTAGYGNVIAGEQYGIVFYGPLVTANRIINNFVGPNPAGNTAIGIDGGGFYAEYGPSNNFIGGAGTGERNVFSGAGFTGIDFYGSGTNGNRVVGNYIGVAADGVTAMGNGNGIVIQNGAANNVIGGTTVVPTTRNIIANNGGAGVYLANSSPGNYIIGNAIGTTALTGGAQAGNNGPGVYISGSSTNNVIGGMDPADGTAASGANTIANNAFEGVDMTSDSSLKNVVSRNSIYNNSGLGIDLGDNGSPEGDTSPYYRAPNISGAFIYSNFTLVTGTLHNGTDAATVQFYTDDSGSGQGQKYLLSLPIASGGPFTLALPLLPAGTHLSAVAIHTGGTNPGDTSEFSTSVDVQQLPAGTITPPHATLLTPNGGTVISEGTVQPITWTVDTAGELQGQSVEYSLDSGATWMPIGNAIPEDLRSWAWLVPNVSTTHARIRVIALDWDGQAGQDDSDADFTIVGTPTVADAAQALRIAGGLIVATPAQMASLNVWTGGTSASKIDILDAVKICRQVAGL